MTVQFKPLGDTAVRVGLADSPSISLHRTIRAFCQRMEQFPIPGVIEWAPAYTAVTVFYRPHIIRYDDLCKRLEELSCHIPEIQLPSSRVFILPVCYGGEYGPDLQFVAGHHNLTVEDVIELHSGRDYLVYMMGFAPGFPYLTGLPEILATPRLGTPRPAVPAGSVGIGGSQTGVYPIGAPGGWRLIGQTPVRLYDPSQSRPILLSPGDYLRFQPVGEKEHAEIVRAVWEGRYVITKRAYERG